MKLNNFINTLTARVASNDNAQCAVEPTAEGLNVNIRKALDSLNQELNQTGSIGKKLDVIGKMILTSNGG